MKVEFLNDGVRLLPDTAEENKDLAERFQVKEPIKAGNRPKVSLIQQVDKFSNPIDNEYFLFIAKDFDQPCRRRRRALSEQVSIDTEALEN